MSLDILPTRTAGAAENMAIDFLLLQRYPNGAAPRFRHYGWRAPAFTFGYGQKIAQVREQLRRDDPFELCRRPTGGGIVDHRNDWTYALVIPRGHPLEEVRATMSYRAVHEALARSLRTLGASAALKPATEPGEDSALGICFERAEIFDVVQTDTGVKIAGAAQKRNKHGLLFQGSISRSAVDAEGFDWDQFEERFAAELAAALEQHPANSPWPDFDEEELSGLIEQYASADWIEYR
jgi:lipoate-protein ligase A